MTEFEQRILIALASRPRTLRWLAHHLPASSGPLQAVVGSLLRRNGLERVDDDTPRLTDSSLVRLSPANEDLARFMKTRRRLGWEPTTDVVEADR